MLWRKIQKSNFRDLNKLAQFLCLDPKTLGQIHRFPVNVPIRLAEKMEKGNLQDPLLRQFVPLPEETIPQQGFVDDPVKDTQFCKSPKLLQKYKGRALILTTSACAMNCRFCFRQNFDYAEKNIFETELKLIQEDHSLHEIILSGGDPLSLADRELEALLHGLSCIPHVKNIRFHTRFPIGIPERIDSSLLDLLAKCPKQIVFVIHTNHPKELDPDVIAALKSLQGLKIPILTHTVLLKGVNDSLSTLKELFETCIFNGIIPYYLNQLDKVTGTIHFEVAKEKGLALIEELRALLPGYAIPRYASEIPGKAHKTIL